MQIFKNITQCLSLLIGLLIIQVAVAQTPTNLGGWQPNGDVLSIVSDNDYIYLGGAFTTLIKEGTSGTFSSGTGVEQTGIGEVVPSFPKVSGTIRSVVPDGSGGWFIGGEFTEVGGVARNRIAHILSDKTLDMTWNPNANSTVYTLAISGTDLYVGGNFSNISGQTRNYIAKLSTTGTGAADAIWNPNANYGVQTLAVSGTDLYVGGGFTTIGGQSRNYIAKLSTTGTGAADATWNPNAINGVVTALAIVGANLYVGGGFTAIGGQIRNRIAKLSTTGTGAADATWNPNAGNSIGVSTLAISGTDLYVGGRFESIGGQTRNNIAKLSTTGTGAADVTWNPNANSFVETLVVSGTDLYVGGWFESIGGQTRNRIAKLSTTGTGAADATWNPNANNRVYALAVSVTDLYVGGDFTIIGGQNRNRIARISKATLELDMTWNPNASNNVYTLAILGTDLYVGGSFTTISGQNRGYIAKLSTTGTGTADATWNPDASNNVWTLSVSGTDLYVGGSFTTIGGQFRNYIAKLSTTGIGAADATWNPNVNGGFNPTVFSLALSGTDLYVGGRFTSIGGQPRNYIAKLSTTGTGTVDATWNPNPNVTAWAISVLGTDLYVGGQFTSIGGKARNRIAKLSTTGTGVADATWNPNANNVVYTLALSGTDLYVGGGFTSIGGQSRNNIAKLNTTGTGAADATWNPSANDDVKTLAVSGTDLYVGGYFTTMGSDFISRFAIFSPTLPEINLQGGSPLVSISDGSATPIVGNNTDFGSGLVSSSITKTFTIQNTGTANLTVSSINVTGTHNTEFVVNGITFPATILPNTTTTFNVAFTPTAINLRTATITINNNDADEAVYDFAVQGTGIVSTGDVLLVEASTNFPTIQAAVDAAVDGQTIQMTVARPYPENVIVTKTLTFTSNAPTYQTLPITRIQMNGATKTLTIDGNMCVTELLDMQNGNVVVTSTANFALRSTASGTAMVVNASTTNTVVGNVIMERYLPAVNTLGYSGTGYRMFSSPFTNAPFSQFGDDMDLVLNTAFNGAAQPSRVRPFPTLTEYVEPLAGTPRDAYNGFTVGYQVPTTVNLVQAKGYEGQFFHNSTVDLDGVLNNGNINIATTNNGNASPNGGFNLVGNPYPSPIRWNDVHALSTNIDDAIYIDVATSQYGANFASYIISTGVGVNGASNNIASMQGFFVYCNNPIGGTVNFANSVRHTAYTNPAFLKQSATKNANEGLIKLAIEQDGRLDETAIYFVDGATPAYDGKYDALKLYKSNGATPTLYSYNENDAYGYFSINGLGDFNEDMILPLAMNIVKSGKHKIVVREIKYFHSLSNVYLYDSLTETLHDLKANPEYEFVAQASNEVKRFVILFKTNTNFTQKDHIVTYPNPTPNNFSYSLKNDREGVHTIRLFDATGKMILEQTENKEGAFLEGTINLEKQSSGLYLLQISDSKQTTNVRIIKE